MRFKSIATLIDKKDVLALLAQRIYDVWDEDDEEFAGGGICHIIADGLAVGVSGMGYDVQTVSSIHEQHVYCVVQADEGVFVLDIPWKTYETGAGYNPGSY